MTIYKSIAVSAACCVWLSTHVVVSAFLPQHSSSYSSPLVIPGSTTTVTTTTTTSSNNYNNNRRTQSTTSTSLFMASRPGTGRDFYKILNVQRNADVAEIKRAYRKLAKEYHPGTFFINFSVLLLYLLYLKHGTNLSSLID